VLAALADQHSPPVRVTQQVLLPVQPDTPVTVDDLALVWSTE
jgi:hypothetical protein